MKRPWFLPAPDPLIDELIARNKAKYIPGMEKDDQELREKSLAEYHRRALASLTAASMAAPQPKLAAIAGRRR